MLVFEATDGKTEGLLNVFDVHGGAIVVQFAGVGEGTTRLRSTIEGSEVGTIITHEDIIARRHSTETGGVVRALVVPYRTSV